MRYKFRGKRVDNGEWVCGDLMTGKNPSITWWKPTSNDSYEIDCADVDPLTVGQYTGLSDKNGKEIYERDIWLYHGVSYVVSWNADEAKYYFKHPNAFAGDDDHIDLGWSSHGELIGNIHDNPELLGG